MKERNKRGKPYYFLQGPPYTSGRLHIGQALNNSLKDIILRYKRMQGFNVWDRAGYDMHGLPTENAVQKKLGLIDKQAIEKFGIGRFVKECISFSNEIAEGMSKDLERIGVWLDYKNAYKPIENDFIEGVWFLIKQAYKQGRLYKGKKVVSWCKNCQTTLAKHELEYKRVREKSIFVKFPVSGKQKEYLLIWTTTPWTLPFNLAVMVNPKADYVKVKSDNEFFIIAEELLSSVEKNVNKKLKVVEKIKGKKLEGLSYVHPFYDELKERCDEIKRKYKNAFTVVLSERYVTTDIGTGLVHCAPGCGPEDFEVGKEYKLFTFNTLDEKGIFKDLEPFDGFVAKDDDEKIVEMLKKKGLLVAEVYLEHDYPFCWRCHKPVIFRATEQWFLKIEDLIDKMLKLNKKVLWVPAWGKEAFDEWIKNLKDISITRQRFWGTPAPIWICEKCKKPIVIGSIKELEKKAINKVPEDLHKPWIDEVKLKCSCGGTAHRIPDVLDVWLDSGTASWNCLYYPKRKDLFKVFFPAKLILEATEQIKLWFSMLLICSIIALKRHCYEAVYMHGMILDWQGKKMSKSLGNIISPYEVIEKSGSDLLRYYMCETNAGKNINFVWKELEQKRKNLNVLWNLKNYVLDLARLLKANPERIKPKLGLEEKYMVSRCNSVIEKVTKLFDCYRIDETIKPIEELFLELSRTYIHLVREKIVSKNDEDRLAVLYTTYYVLLNSIKLFSPICPFITEAIYQELRKEFGLKEESIHLCMWPKAEKKKINKKLEKDFSTVLKVIEKALAKRSEAKIGIRWPLSKLTVTLEKPLQKDFLEVIARQVNVKKVEIKKGKSLVVELDTTLTKELEAEGFAREIVRFVQAARKKAGLVKEQRIELFINCSSKLKEMLSKYVGFIKQRVNATEIMITEDAKKIKQKIEELGQNFEKKIKNESVLITFKVV